MAWEKVYPLVGRHLGALNIPVFVSTTYHKGMQANEKA